MERDVCVGKGDALRALPCQVRVIVSAQREDPSVIRSRRALGLPERFLENKRRNPMEQDGDGGLPLNLIVCSGGITC